MLAFIKYKTEYEKTQKMITPREIFHVDIQDRGSEACINSLQTQKRHEKGEKKNVKVNE